jgi:hypothetical protein
LAIAKLAEHQLVGIRSRRRIQSFSDVGFERISVELATIAATTKAVPEPASLSLLVQRSPVSVWSSSHPMCLTNTSPVVASRQETTCPRWGLL